MQIDSDRAHGSVRAIQLLSGRIRSVSFVVIRSVWIPGEVELVAKMNYKAVAWIDSESRRLQARIRNVTIPGRQLTPAGGIKKSMFTVELWRVKNL